MNETFDKKYLNYDSSNLPPCRSELHEHFLRAQYIASVWSNANLKEPTTSTPENNGWILDDNKYIYTTGMMVTLCHHPFLMLCYNLISLTTLSQVNYFCIWCLYVFFPLSFYFIYKNYCFCSRKRCNDR